MTSAIVYVPLLAHDFGMTNSEIGLLVAAYQTMLLLSNTLFGRWADFADRRSFVLAGLTLSALAIGIHIPVRNAIHLFLVRMLAGICLGVYPAALTAYVYEHDRRLGRFTGFGALGWGTGALVAGVINTRFLFLSAGLLMAASAAVAAIGLHPQRLGLRQSFFDMGTLKSNWRLYSSFLLRHLGAFSIWTIFPLYISELGATRFWIGVIWAINPLGQFLFMPLLDRTNDRLLIRAGLLLSIAVFLAFGLATNWRQLVPIQIALALSWSCLYLGSLKHLMRVNAEHSTAAGMLGSTLSLAAVLGALLEGFSGNYGYRTVMFVAAGFALAGASLFGLRD